MSQKQPPKSYPTKLSKKWIDPLYLAYQISISDYKENWCFLYSALSKKIKNSKSYIGLYPIKQIVGDDFNELKTNLENPSNQKNKYFGYFGYGLKNQLENLKTDENSFINLPDLWMINFGVVLEFNHDKKQVLWHTNQSNKNSFEVDFADHIAFEIDNNKTSLVSNQALNLKVSMRKPILDRCANASLKNSIASFEIGDVLESNFNKVEYLKKVKTIQSHIEAGDIYQANLTRKFFGEFAYKPKNNFEIFLELTQASPANYSSFFKLDDNYIISSSPELFLKINKENVLSSPIKGTAKKFRNKKLDELSKQNLQNSSKEQAENLMIVDLVRNDLSKQCLVGSVRVKNLFKISSYKTLHHLSSDICGIKKPDSSILDVIKSSFPAGSMTGAPKIKAMEICSNLEKQRRGVYSGAIGFVDHKNCNLSVAIRTLIVKENKFEFQVGGAITFDSIPQKEWQETINKARGIAKALGIKLSKLKAV